MAAPDETVWAALEAFADDFLDGTWSGRREREAVSMFAFGPLLQQVSSDGFLSDPTQIGLEVPVPQVAVEGVENQGRRKRQVTKDVVIWPEPLMTCWDSDDNPTVPPAAILEWKFDSAGISSRDVNWLDAFTGEYTDSVGYTVTANPPGSNFLLSCTRVTGEEVRPEWVHVP